MMRSSSSWTSRKLKLQRRPRFGIVAIFILQREMGIKNIDEFNEVLVRQFFKKKSHLAKAAAENYRRSFVVFSRFLYLRKILDSNPMEFVRPIEKKKDKQRPPTFTAEQVKAILAEAKRGRMAVRDTALIMILLDSGIRIGEAANLELDKVDWQGRSMLVDGKTGEREVPLTGQARYNLRRYVEQHRRAPAKEQHVFVTNEGNAFSGQRMSLNLRRFAQRAEVVGPKLGAHTYRHTFASNYIKNGGDPFTLQQILGHTTMAMTSVYVYMNKTDLRHVHARFSPLKSLLK